MLAREQALLFGQAKRASREHTSETRLTRPNRRACSQAIFMCTLYTLHHPTPASLHCPEKSLFFTTLFAGGGGDSH